MSQADRSDFLPKTLATWQVQPPRHPQFRAAVWARLEAGRQPAAWTGYFRRHTSVVVGTVALAIVAGALGGREHAQARIAADNQRMAAAYVEALDARLMQTP
jgi:hypothetical protein